MPQEMLDQYFDGIQILLGKTVLIFVGRMNVKWASKVKEAFCARRVGNFAIILFLRSWET